ncbi:MAG: M24 family metallopeptidase [Bacillota bacterium]
MKFAANHPVGLGGRPSDWGGKVLPYRERARITKEWLKLRLETILPDLMKRNSFDMWIVCVREYNEGPLIMTLLPSPMLTARRRTILVFTRQPDDTVERIILARPGLGVYDLYKDELNRNPEDAINVAPGETQWEALARIVRERDPKTIGINISETFQFADDLTYTEYNQLMAALGPKYAQRVRGAEKLSVGWLERRLPVEIQAYPGIQHIAYGIIKEAFSPRVAHPGVTTGLDLAWWMRQRVHDLGLTTYFQPTVSIQRQGVKGNTEEDAVIQQGDILHCDFGIYYLGLHTDIQELAYVLKFGESDAPAGLKAALATGNRLQDILAEEMIPGRSGNEILRASLSKAAGEGIRAMIYTHPIGTHIHAAGMYVGMTDMQQGVPGTGDWVLVNDTCYSFELNIKQYVPEWDQDVTIALETDVAVIDGRVYYLGGRQTEFHLVE